MTKTNCFAYKDGKCMALDVYKCGNCNFYKPKHLHEEQSQKAYIKAVNKGYYGVNQREYQPKVKEI